MERSGDKSQVFVSFPDEFIWGSATASYQIEGGTKNTGRGKCVWDMMCELRKDEWNGESGENACAHYYKYAQDVEMMKELGLKAYRFSVSWPRVLPEGKGKVNQAGIDFYDKLIDELLKAGIDPYLTLFHWDYPYELYKKGGWLNEESSDWFADYTSLLVDKYSDRVKNWLTFNEPQCFVDFGHRRGLHAPGLKLSFREVLLATHNTLLSHGKAVQAIRQRSKQKCKIGLAPVGMSSYPKKVCAEDIQAAKDKMFSIKSKDCWNNTWWLDPIFFGAYPSDGMDLFKEDLPEIKDSDMAIISSPIDYFAFNLYCGTCVEMSDSGEFRELKWQEGYPVTAMGWPITPEAIYWGAKLFYERYKKPILITENGMANTDWVNLDGKVHDHQRIDFVTRYLTSLNKAINDGVDIRGYFYWSIMDNFEWTLRYSRRFGLIYVDYQTQERVFKDSAFWYQKIIETNGECMNEKNLEQVSSF